MFDPCTQSRRILIIDDNDIIHDDFEKVLKPEEPGLNLSEAELAFFGEEETEAAPEHPEFDIEHASQGEEGVRMVASALEQDQPFDMAFVDMRMPPGWDGLKTIEELWKVDAELEVVICSAYSDYSWSQIVERLGHSHRLLILRKPFDNVEVLQMSLALTEKRHASRVAAMKMNQICELVSEKTETLQQEKMQADAMMDELLALMS